ncbi:MAG: alkaline phosphatase D family protein [Planctomycetota bacterium]|jgi:alkaline phosphatase/alkaline phosphatase D
MRRFMLSVLLGSLLTATVHARPYHMQGEMAGEATADSVILQSRLTGNKLLPNGDVPGANGVARFLVAKQATFRRPIKTEWITADPDYDYIIKTKVTGLEPNTIYRYRLEYGADKSKTTLGPVRSFKTLAGADTATRTRFVVVTGMNYAFFQNGAKNDGKGRYEGTDKALGFPALKAIADLRPQYFIGTGDNIYYDHFREFSATDAPTMRWKWHEQFVQPRFVELFANTATYWEKDDHDHRYNDSDRTGDRPPSNELGIEIFKEQVPVTDPKDPDAVTYRTHRVSKDLQLWFLEGRDYRSPNRMPNGPGKTLWGAEQFAWLKSTLLKSDATFKVVVSPTPLVGPDGSSKIDSHVNLNGFRYEGDEFFKWAQGRGLKEKGLYLVCGDRHWQYHSIHPSGFEEFSSGALVQANSRMGVDPGTRRSTDPSGLIRQPFTSTKPTAGFLSVTVSPASDKGDASITFGLYDRWGELLYSQKRTR